MSVTHTQASKKTKRENCPLERPWKRHSREAAYVARAPRENRLFSCEEKGWRIEWVERGGGSRVEHMLSCDRASSLFCFRPVCLAENATRSEKKKANVTVSSKTQKRGFHSAVSHGISRISAGCEMVELFGYGVERAERRGFSLRNGGGLILVGVNFCC